jgi:hypothetical protein
MLGAFFIVTDPVSGCTTPRGKLIFAAGIALLTWIIRTFGAYPDGIAFAVLLMNIAAPLIDMNTQPPVFGHKRQGRPRRAMSDPLEVSRRESSVLRISVRTGVPSCSAFTVVFTAP